jgi:hypothetical protein
MERELGGEVNLLLRIFGWPHEALHVLALWLIGRRAVKMTRTYVDIPDDLSTLQYVFVAGLPALVFFTGLVLSVQVLFSAANLLQAALWFVLSSLFGLAALGTLGDILLILQRLFDDRTPPPDEN